MRRGTYVIGAALAYVIISGLLYADLRLGISGCAITMSPRRSAGMALIVGLPLSAAWPVGLPVSLMMTGFAEHGFWLWNDCDA